MSDFKKIHCRKSVKVQRAFGSTEEWSVNERAGDSMWISHHGDVYSTDQLDELIKSLIELQKYIKKRKRK